MSKVKDLRYDIKLCQSVPFDHNDYAKIVRCKDCKYYNQEYKYCKAHSETPNEYAPRHIVYMYEYDYCSYGESKNEG